MIILIKILTLLSDGWTPIYALVSCREKVSTQIGQRFILLEGDGRDQTVIEWDDHAPGPGKNYTLATLATFSSSADNFVAKNITFKVFHRNR